ncbi:MAG TPA: A/G-specific adenine glycosylase, partial [Planctomycetaceae bacterium]|nr:A/G-specific adenine glycosylase [Planctomycetaceae bacterium]
RQQELFPAERSAGLEIPEGLSPALIPRLETYLKEQADIEASLQQLVTEIRHSVTRYKIRLLCFVAQLEQRAAKKKKNQLNSEAGKSGYQWVSV